MKYDEVMETECPICGKTIKFNENVRGYMYLNDECVGELTRDCHGIPYRTVCCDCYYKIMETKGYDGEYYTELDGCVRMHWL